MQPYIEHREELHVYLRDGKPLFAGTPDRVVVFPRENVRVCIDYKTGRAEVPPADVNMQVRAYLTMIPVAEFDDGGVPFAYSEEFRPSSMLRLQKCPGSLQLARNMASQGLSEPEPSEDASEGKVLHKAICERLEPREHLTPEQFDVVLKAEAMEQEFLDFVLGADPKLPFYGAILQPRTSAKADMVFYTDGDIEAARLEINAIWDAAHAENAHRHASGDACKFCPCKVLCPEFKEWAFAVEKIAHLPAAQWTSEMWDVFLTRRTDLQKFLEDRYEEAKEIVSVAPEAIPNWELKPGAERRHVEDVVEAWKILGTVISAREFSNSCTLSLTGLETIVWQHYRDAKTPISQKEAKKIVNGLLAKAITLKRTSPSLKRVKEI
jgi:Protein of unknown function (DUF2800)